MVPKLGWRSRAGGVCLVVLLCGLPTWAAGKRAEADDGTVQVMADVILIDRQCRQVAVNFGELFRYAEQHGVHSVDIMPLGSKSAMFLAAMKRREQVTSDAELCSDVAATDAAAIPGVIGPR